MVPYSYNESEVTLRIADGDETAFSEFFHHYTAQLHLHILALVKSKEAVEDILQETFINIWLHRDQLPGIEKVRAWVFTIASNLCYNFLKKQVREAQKIQNLRIEPAATSTESDDKNREQKEILSVIQQAIQQLPPQRKRIWTLHRELGMKQADIASELNISLSTVKNTLAKCLEFIRECLEKKGFHHFSILMISFFRFFFHSNSTFSLQGFLSKYGSCSASPYY